jgi:flagellar motor switch protein FliN/FliY
MPNDEDDLREIDVKNTDFSSGAEETLANEETDPTQDQIVAEEAFRDSEKKYIEDSKEDENLPAHSEVNLKKSSISDLSVRVQVEVSRFDVSLEELMKMEPGYRLPVEINPTQVNLTVNGKLIGKGEMVEIGNQVGVRITELYK